MSVVGVIGTGNMGSALVRGWLRAPREDCEFVVWDKVEAATRALLECGPVRVAASLEELVAASDLLLVVVKPKDAAELFGSVAGLLQNGHTVVSAMAGVSLASLRSMVGREPAVVRIMPNLGVALGVGAIAVATEPQGDAARLQQVLSLLEPLGLAEVLPENLIDAVTALAGSGPGFLALAMEGLEDGAVAAGLARSQARALVRQVAYDLAGQLATHGDSPGELLHHLASTGQLFEPGIDTLVERQVRSAFQQAVEAAVERSRRSGGAHVSPR
jgi:pyrroline-5-carboxylate reductase